MAAPAQGRGLFGSPASSQPASNSLFGQPASNGAASSLFGSTTAGATGGLFGKPATTGAASSLFGQPAAPAQGASSSLFGQPASSALPPTGSGASLFGGSMAGQTGRNPLASTTNGQTLNSGGQALQSDPSAAPAYFQTLLDRNKRRQMDANSSDELPKLQLGLQDISRKVRNLGQGGPSSNARGTDAKAHYLLSASGVNTGQALRDLEQLAGPTAVSAQDQADIFPSTGVKETLAQTYQSDFQKMVESHVQRAHEEFDKMVDERLHAVDWDASRHRIYEHFGLKRPQNPNGSTSEKAGFGRSSRRGRVGGSSVVNGSTFGVPGMAKSVIGVPGPRGVRNSIFADVSDKVSTDGIRPAPEDGILRRKQDKYSERVKDLNVARIQEKAYPVLTRFAEVESEPTNEDTTMLINALKALVEVTGEHPSKENLAEPGVVRERQYARDYLDDNPNSKGHISIRKRIIKGSRTFLEKQFHAQLENIVNKNPREANIGGVPTPLAKVKGYVRVRAARKELGPDIERLQEVNGDYCWPLVFYMLRSGLHTEALQYVDENAAAFRQIDRQFMRYLRAYVGNEDNRLPPDLQTSISNEYSQRQRLAPEDSIDPYRMMCYKVVGRCELTRRNLDNINNEMVDWMWLQFVLAREYNRVDEFAHEAFGLDDVRQSVKEVGERYFGPGSEIANAPNTLCFMQILSGMFEKAVADLYPHNYLSATHLAIALDFYGLLRVADISNSDDLLSYTTRQQPQIAFGSMVGLYTRDFRTANATAAVDYISLICLNADLTGQIGKAQRELCHQALTEVVLETREFAQLLGDIRADGQRIKGAIEQRLKLIGLENERDFLKYITLVAARTAQEQSRTTDAALLYHLSEDYEKVIAIVNEAVSLALVTELGEQPARLAPLKPRDVENQNNQSGAEQQASLSLTAIDDPIKLSREMRQLYLSNTMYYQNIHTRALQSNQVLLVLADARNSLEMSDWARTADLIHEASVLPTQVNGSISAIRLKAQSFDVIPTPIARTVGHVMVWELIALSNQADRLRRQEYDTGSRLQTLEHIVQTAKDVMVFAGLIRYKLPGRVWETLASAAQDLGAY